MNWLVYVGVGAVVLTLGARFAVKRMIRGNVISGVPIHGPGNVKGKRALVVGGTGGLGLEIARALAAKGAIVTVAGRKKPNDDNLAFLRADLLTVKAQLEFANAIPEPEKLDILVQTQGILARAHRVDNGEGIEEDLAISSVSRIVITEKLLERKFKGKIFIMGFCGNNGVVEDLNGLKNYVQWPQHFNTIAVNDALILHTRRAGYANIYGLNPGLIPTSIRDNVYNGSRISTVVESIIALLTPTAQQYGQQIVDTVISSDELDPKQSVFFNQLGESVEISNSFKVEKNFEDLYNQVKELIEQAKKKQ